MKVQPVMAKVSMVCMLLAGLVACQVDQENVGMSGGASSSLQSFEALKAAKPQDNSPLMVLDEGDDEALIADETRDEGAQVTGWQLQLRTGRSVFKLGEPVFVQVSLQNTAGEAQNASALLQPEFRMLTYTVTAPDGSQHVFQPIAEFCTLPLLARKTFQPGEQVQEEVRLFAARGGWMFDQPGDYLISVEFTGPSRAARQLLSNSLRVRIEPGSEREQAAARRLMEGEAALLLQWERGDHLERGLKVLDEVRTQYPGTIHAFYAEYVLGNNLAQSFLNGKVERPAVPEAALAHLQTAHRMMVQGMDQGLSTHVRSNLTERLVDVLLQLQRQAQAREVALDFVSRYASEPSMTEAREQMQLRLKSM